MRLGLMPLIAAALLLSGCASVIDTAPINAPVAAVPAGTTEFLPVDAYPEVAVGLAFSGGGTRAAAFAYGAMQELDRLRLSGVPGQPALLETVDFVSGVSGGSVAAAYFGLKGRAALHDFRERFLLQDAEAGFSTSVSIGNLVNVATKGGANGSSDFSAWLDSNLFDGATYAEFRRRRGQPAVWISATDLYNRVPFVFTRDTFAALCSDLDALPIARAVATSAAFPVVFAPVNAEAYARNCPYRLPAWAEKALTDRSASASSRAFAAALMRYRDPAVMRYVKLADGGVTDNFGIQGITLARNAAITPYDPLTPEVAVRLKRALFLVVDAGRGPSANWPLRRSGPGGLDMLQAVADAATDASSRGGYDVFRLTIGQWRDDLVRWRCGLSTAEVMRLRGGLVGWNCRELDMRVGEVAFVDTGPEREAALNQVPTRFKLPPATVDFVIESGRIAIRNEPAVQDFLRGGRGMTLVSR